MKNTFCASLILSMACIFLLVGCDSIYVPNVFGSDEVPDEIKTRPHIRDAYTPVSDKKEWPRLGDVPFKPKDFTPKAEYDRSMDELRRSRQEAEASKNATLRGDLTLQNAAAQNESLSSLQPPQFPSALQAPKLPFN